MRARFILAAALALGLAGCTRTLDVTGQAVDGGETFIGSATGHLDGAGTIEMTSSRGVKCSGTFVYVTRRTGSGTFTCGNGESGAFDFVSTGSRGTATGRIGGRGVTFTFG